MSKRQGFTTIPTDGLVLDIPLDGNANAKVGSNGTATNVTWIDSEKGYTKEVGSFDGATSYLNTNSNPFTALGANPTVSISTMFKYYSGNGTNDRIFGNYNNVYQLFSIIDNGAGGLNFATRDSGGTLYNNVITYTFVVGEWYNVVVIKAPGYKYVYVNSVLTDTITDTSTGNYDSGANIFLGDSPILTNKTIVDIGLFKVYNRALTQSEIQNLYIEGQRLLGSKAKYPALLNGTVGYWDFKGGELSNLVDGSLATNNGATLTTDHLGRSNNAYSFDGVSNNISIPSGTSISGGTARTLSIGIKKGTSTGIETIYESGTVAIEQQFRLHHSVNSQNDVYISFNSNDYYTSTNAITDGIWHYISIVYDGGILSTSTVHIYIDGISQSLTKAGTGTGSANTGIGVSYLGQDSATRYFEGSLSSPLIQNRALSASEVKDLYTLTKSNYIYEYSKETTLGLQNGLVMELDGDGNDISGNGNNGTPTAVTKMRVNQSEGGSYNGTTSKIDTTLNMSGSSMISANVWVKWNGNTSTIREIINDRAGGGTTQSLLMFLSSTPEWLFSINTQSTEVYIRKTSSYIPINTWTMITLTYDGSNVYLYKNGIQDGSFAQTGSTGITANIDIGGNADLTGRNFDGEILRPKIWNRALSAKEVEQEYYLNYIN